MKPSEINRILKKFWGGESTRDEEEILFSNNQYDELKTADRAYFQFIKNARNTHFSAEDEIWHSIVAKEIRRKRAIYFSLGLAASILLLVALVITSKTFLNNKNIETQYASNNINDYYKIFRNMNGSNPILYINGCKSSADYNTAILTINPNCIQHINLTDNTKDTRKNGNKKGIVEVWLKGKSDEIFSVCEGTLYFLQDGEIKSISINDECSPNLLVDCSEKPLSEIEELKPQQIKSIELTTNPRNCNGQLNGEFIVLESK
jgi:hypothetical protein